MATCQQCAECPPVPAVIPVCADPQYCSEINYSRCIIYKGPALANLNIVDGEDLNSILTKIDALVVSLVPNP